MMSKPNVSRRRFLNQSLAVAGVAGGFAIAGTKSSGRIIGANETIHIAVAGLNGRGGAHVDAFSKIPGVEITHLVDPDTRTFAKRVALIEKRQGRAPEIAQDIRRVLENKTIDAVSVATPNHWHALITIWACQAGKDVYVEKPCSHNVHEGRVAVEAARKYGRIVQHGTQNRSSRDWARAAALIRSGTLGKLLVSRALCYKPRKSIGFKPVSAPPAQLDFDIWLGPAPRQPFHANLVHYEWHWFWDFGNGDIGNQGVHEMDKARWLIPATSSTNHETSATFPKTVLSLGGRFGYADQGQTANTQITFMDYGDTQLIFEVRGLKSNGFDDEEIGNIAHLEEGIIAGGNNGSPRFYPKGQTKPVPLSSLFKGAIELGPGSNHFGNFIAAVRSRKIDELNADILEGHHSASLCHLANVSYRLGQDVPFNKRSGAFGDDSDAYESFARMEVHLKQNKVALDGLKYRLGRRLTLDPATELFIGDAAANQLLTRPYRTPFVVPERIV
jgi:predicted dehydrogenase